MKFILLKLQALFKTSFLFCIHIFRQKKKIIMLEYIQENDNTKFG